MEDFKKKFNVLLMDKFNINEINFKEDIKFTDLGANSLDIVELMVGFENVFKISIPDDDIEKIVTIGDAETYLKRRLNIH